MAREINKPAETEASSTATPEEKGTAAAERTSATTDSNTYIVNVTEEYLGRSFIITAAPEAKKRKSVPPAARNRKR